MSERVAGPALNAEVAEKVMGCKLVRYGDVFPRSKPPYSERKTCGCAGEQHRDQSDGGRNDDCLQSYSTDIAAAWEVVGKLLVQGWVCGVCRAPSKPFWVATVEGDRDAGTDADDIWEVVAATAPLAICLAALKAVEGSP